MPPQNHTTAPPPAPQAVSVDRALALAVDHHRGGRLAEAEAIYAQIAAQRPNHVDAVHLLGMVARQLGRHEEAVELLGRAIALKPDFAPAHVNLGKALRALGRADDAAGCFERAAQLDPKEVEAPFNLGEIEQARGRYDEALRAYQATIAREPMHAGALDGVGRLLHMRGQPHDAVGYFAKAVRSRPDFVEAYVNLGTALEGSGRLDDAVAAYRRAIELLPERPEAYNNLAGVLREQRKLDEALATYRRALELEPGHAVIHSNLIFTMDVDERTSVAESQAERRRWHAAHALPDTARYREWPNPPDPERKLRIGYVSADFRRHSAAYTFAPVLRDYDRQRFEVFCYSGTRLEDDLTARFKSAVDQWRPIRGMADEALARLVRDDAIDLLVDLSGHTAGNRLRMFTAKPAPVQVTAWAGSGTGVAEIDYLLSDGVIVPPAERPLFVEQLYELPCGFAYQPPADAPEPGPLPAAGGNPFTFGCLNRFGKVSDRVMALWARILSERADSRLLLKDRSFSVAENCQAALDRLARLGVARERVVLQGSTNLRGHLEAYGAVDLALDTFPQNGGVTTLEALWMGVPVVTRKGAVPQARVAASILSALGLQQFVADSDEGYVEIALRRSAALAELAALRAALRARLLASPIANAAAHVAAVEDAYRTMWRRWCEPHQLKPARGWARWRKNKKRVRT